MSSATPDQNISDVSDPAALGAAADAVRRLISHIRKTKAPREVLERVAREADAISDQLEGYDHPGPYAQRQLVVEVGPMPTDIESPAEFFPYSPVVGRFNPIAPPIDFQVAEDELRAEHIFDAQYNGPPAAVHGGIIALVFDELLGSCGVVFKSGGFTGTLSIRYSSLTPIGHPIRMRAWVDRHEGRKIFIRGTMHHGETLCSEAEGIFIQPTTSVVEAALEKFSTLESDSTN